MGGPSRKRLVSGFVIALVMLAAFAARAGELRVSVTGVRSNTGELLIGLYDNAKGFEGAITTAETSGLMADRDRIVGVAIRAQSGLQQAVFAQLRPGRYAIIVLHDQNDNGRLDANAIGIPTEGYGFSNDARGLLSAPSFDAAAVTIDSADVSIVISLSYPWAASREDTLEYNQFFGGAQPGK